jgi:hypothetical protein
MKLFISDIKSIIRVPVLLCALLFPVIAAFFLLFCSPLIRKIAGNSDLFGYGRFYSVTAISLFSAIPVIYGLLFSYIHLSDPYYNDQRSQSISDTVGHILLSRIIVTGILSLTVMLPVILLTDPVSTQGWLRGIYAALILSASAPFIFLVMVASDRSGQGWGVLLAIVFLLAVPAGMSLHRPWNYFAFFSPYYWSGWAWVITSPVEGLIYGLISLVLTAAGSIVFYRSIPGDKK